MAARGAIGAAVVAMLLVHPAQADHAPVVVVPGKPGVPVLRYGAELSGAVVYGDWGLYRPGHGRVIIEGPVFYTAPSAHGAYYPYTGMKPRSGRLEVDTPRPPRGGPSFRRQWGIESDPQSPVTVYPPYEPPHVTVEPRPRRR
ncbi:MAG: hypothetical protein M5U07_05905 [Xanthobacteraceae bacterium]|nr:hypothetical protein [Xanthobacteraceae bacterium]